VANIDCYFQIQLKKSLNYEVELENDFFKSLNACNKRMDADITVQTKLKAGLANCKAHRCLLANASPVWSSMLSNEDNREILKMTDLDHNVSEEILRFIYDGEITGESMKTHMKSLLNAAREVT
jgi:hypothetical protein